MWVLYALVASLVWGINYAASGRVIKQGLSTGTLFLLDLVFGAIAIALIVLSTGGGLQRIAAEVSGLGKDVVWLLVAMIAATCAGLLTLVAIQGKNATVASMIEISYPFFVALFCWLFFREVELNWPTLIGGCIILAGVLLVFLGNR